MATQVDSTCKDGDTTMLDILPIATRKAAEGQLKPHNVQEAAVVLHAFKKMVALAKMATPHCSPYFPSQQERLQKDNSSLTMYQKLLSSFMFFKRCLALSLSPQNYTCSGHKKQKTADCDN